MDLFASICKIPKFKQNIEVKLTTSDAIKKLLLNPDSKNISGYGNIINKILKAIAVEICTPLTFCINHCITEGYFPQCMKHCKLLYLSQCSNL